MLWLYRFLESPDISVFVVVKAIYLIGEQRTSQRSALSLECAKCGTQLKPLP